jgi:hypothetical protein
MSSYSVEEVKDSELVIDEDGQHPFLTHSMTDEADEAVVIDFKKVMVASN